MTLKLVRLFETKEARNENCNPDPMHFTGADLCRLRAQWFMADQSTEETSHVLQYTDLADPQSSRRLR